MVMGRWGWREVFFVSLLSIPYLWVIRRYLRETQAFLRVREARAEAQRTGVAVPAGQRASFRELWTKEMRFRTVVLFLGEFFHVFRTAPPSCSPPISRSTAAGALSIRSRWSAGAMAWVRSATCSRPTSASS